MFEKTNANTQNQTIEWQDFKEKQMKEILLRAVRSKHQAKMEEALANIAVYEHSVGIGEHPDLVEAVETQVDKYVHALEIVEGVNSILGDQH
jgi:hypothetical protein